MRQLLFCLAVMTVIVPRAAPAEGEVAGAFDYYVLSLSWSPNWCALEGDARNSPQCDEAQDFGWILHGLWPQYVRGYPSFCQTSERPPSRGITAGMADIMGTAGLAWHQWKKHGSCAGMPATQYYATARAAFETIERPAVFRKVKTELKLPASVVEEAFLKSNPDMVPDGVTVTCKSGYIQEVRICLSKDLGPVPCGHDVIRDCTLKDALFTPIR